VTRKTRSKKISREFATRLDRLAGDEKVRAVVLLRTQGTAKPSGKRQSPEERAAAVEAVRSSAERALGDVDKVLARFDGKRLAKKPDALGSIPVETTADGIRALASSRRVQAILEDQPLRRIP
jgi:sorbitol-specific phosphotransferase system component IIA